MTIAVEKPVPDFSAEATDGPFKLSEHRGHTVVLYFYPRDNTPGCTVEGSDFAALHKKFLKAGAKVYGLSRDTLKSHEKFKAKMDYPFALIADPDETVCQLFSVMKDKNMYGKKVRGIERSTFVISPEGKLLREWRGVKISGHAEEVLAEVQAFVGSSN